ncbi:MBL fold metallo-hydrolase [Pelagibaculum spongiae]|nr:MBL fold metallo-hydrolase [Pelagibaculum spongiae]
MSADIRPYFHQDTSTWCYLVSDPQTQQAAIIDPVMDFDQKSGQISSKFIDKILADIHRDGLLLKWVLETHAHADHLSAGAYLRQKTGARIGIGEHIQTVQKTFFDAFNEADQPADGSQFDFLFSDNSEFFIGELPAMVMHTPGHTPACVSYLIGDGDLFIGDTLFMPDVGTARCDFPGGDAKTLYRSLKEILALPKDTRLWLCHDYPEGREACPMVTVAEQRARNFHIHDGVTEAAFLDIRTSRDAKLAVPQLLYPSLQVNIRAGDLPDPESNGQCYLKLPIKMSK